MQETGVCYPTALPEELSQRHQAQGTGTWGESLWIPGYEFDDCLRSTEAAGLKEMAQGEL